MQGIAWLLTDGAEDRDAVAEAVEGHGDRGVTAHPALVVAEPDVEATAEEKARGEATTTTERTEMEVEVEVEMEMVEGRKAYEDSSM